MMDVLRSRSTDRRWFRRLSVLAAGLVLVSGIVVFNTISELGVEPLRVDVARATSMLTGVRVIVVVGLLLAWPALLTFSRRYGWIDPTRQQRLRNMRGRLAFWFVSLELVFGLDAINRLLIVLRGPLS